jgi:hypothetical protein
MKVFLTLRPVTPTQEEKGEGITESVFTFVRLSFLRLHNLSIRL